MMAANDPQLDRPPAGVGSVLALRRMRLADIDQVHAIDRISFSLPWPASSFRYELEENPTSLLWVAENHQPGGAHIVGYIVVWLVVDEAHIATIAIHPDYRGQGISRRLMTVALREAVGRGARLATLEVRVSNQAAQAVYRRFRFKVVGLRPRYYRDNFEDALIMTVQPLDTEYLAWLDTWQPKHQDGDGLASESGGTL